MALIGCERHNRDCGSSFGGRREESGYGDGNHRYINVENEDL